MGRQRKDSGGDERSLQKWKGYPDEENLDCDDLIHTFEEKRRKDKAGGAGGAGTSTSTPEPTASSRRRTASKDETPVVADKRSRRATPGRPAKDKSLEEDFDDAMKKPRGGFERGLRPDRILGATDASGELMFLMKWLDSDEADLVPAKMANVKSPQIVIKFYQDRLTWHSNAEELNAEESNDESVYFSALDEHIDQHLSPEPNGRNGQTAGPRTTATTSRATAPKPTESKPLAKPAPTTRVPIASRSTAPATTRTTTSRTNGTTAATSTSTPTKPLIKSSASLRTATTAPKPASTGAKPAVNGVKASPTKAPLPSKQVSTSRLPASRTAPSAASKTTSISSKTIADKKPTPKTSSLLSKAGVKPIAAKTETKSAAVPKTNGLSAAPTASARTTPSATIPSAAPKVNNWLKVDPLLDLTSNPL